MRVARLLAATLLCGGITAAASAPAPPLLPPDARYKADVLLVVGHPDDETAVSGFLARCVFDRHKRVAVVFGTHGDAGSNAVGNEAAGALSPVRDIEVRQALASWDIHNVWFLGGQDTASQNVLRSLETWHHGTALADLVRLVRLTRPEVVLTWLPDYAVGENHGDHQAAGVLATEAFDMAGDPVAFPEQVAAPRDATALGNQTEGLRPWQPRKLYFFSDTIHPESLDGWGPAYATTDVSPARGVPYYRLSADEWKFHRTQDDVAGVAVRAEATGDWSALTAPERLVFGKSVVGGTRTEDVFAHLQDHPSPLPPPLAEPAAAALELGGPWGFYRSFWPAHHLNLDGLWPPEAVAAAEKPLLVPLVLRHATDHSIQVPLTRLLPAGWTEKSPGFSEFPVGAGQEYPVQLILTPPAGHEKTWQTLMFKTPTASVTLRVFMVARPDVPQEGITTP